MTRRRRTGRRSSSCRTTCGGRPSARREDIVGRTVEIDGRHARGRRRHAGRLRPHGQPGRRVAAAPAGSVPPPVSSRVTFSSVLGRLKDDVTRGAGGGGAGVARGELGSRAPASAGTCSRRATTSCRWSPCRTRSSARRAVPSGCCRRRSRSCCSSPAPTWPTSCWRAPRPAAASSPYARHSAPAGGGCSRSSRLKASCCRSLGGAIGLALAWAGVRALVVAYPDGLPRVADIAIDPAVLGFTLLVSVVTGVAFGLAPLLHSLNEAPSRLLNERATRGATSARHAVRRALVARRSGARGRARGGRGADVPDGREPDERRCRIRSVAAGHVRSRACPPPPTRTSISGCGCINA